MFKQKYKIDCSCCGFCVTAGFTMIELLIVLVIASIIGALALPSFTQFLNTERLEATTDQLAQSFTSARSSAIKTGNPVIMCASSNETSCTGTWSDGWLIFVDEDRDGVPGTDDEIVHRTRRGNDLLTIDIETTGGDAVSSVSFNYRGAPNSSLDVTVSRDGQDVLMAISPFGKPLR